MIKVDRKELSLAVKERKIRIKFLNTSMKNKNHRLTLGQLTTLKLIKKEILVVIWNNNHRGA